MQNSVECYLRILSQETPKFVLVWVHILAEEISCAIDREHQN